MASTEVSATALLKATTSGLGANQFFQLPALPGHLLLRDDQNSDVQPRSARGNLLLFAAASGDMQLVRFAVEDLGLSIGDETEIIGTAVHVACSAGKPDVLAYLLLRDAGHALTNHRVGSYGSESPLQCAAAAGSRECVRQLVAAGADLQASDPTGHRHNALTRALHVGRWEMARWLADTYGRDAVNGGESQLRSILNSVCAFPWDATRLAFAFDTLGLSPRAVVDGWSLAMRVVMCSRDKPPSAELSADMISFLEAAVAAGVDVQQPNASGQTPAQKARELGHDAVAEHLESIMR